MQRPQPSPKPHSSEGAVPASGLRVLASDADAPVVTKTPVEAHALHALQVLAEGLIEEVGVLLGGLAVLDVALTIQHPGRNLELHGVADNCHNLVHLVRRELARALVQVDVALLADDVGDPAAD
eukprot:CAMPEP_0177333910 /NCGR_PEP_ID=MMETSP0368-20130122/22441_1 /TAXON_ID=447022 ORGANISM="Scrippsiella hangoei-like, Strain SHHI-4" /NCGR_SAMPLE_ID=MMETSP0368 /ASSEMBLY_ACC=CAM_ASM_000363 /LENGTH=123 /DNA_ID=CAMNT_0018794601 /DNA_START=42 /DNA_END=410 /DNA_ORIENTATION=+